MINGNIDDLAVCIAQTSGYFQQQAQKQVNAALTLRNWSIGFYLFEYEQHGRDRAEYGSKTLSKLAASLKKSGLKGLGITNLKLFRQFYMTYPQIGQTLSGQFRLKDAPVLNYLELASTPLSNATAQSSVMDVFLMINQLSFSHIIELLKADSVIKRDFYAIQAIQNSWSVRELQRAINSMLFERTGLSSDKAAVLQKQATGSELTAEDIFRDPYMLEFLGLSEKPEYSELDLGVPILTGRKRTLRNFSQI